MPCSVCLKPSWQAVALGVGMNVLCIQEFPLVRTKTERNSFHVSVETVSRYHFNL